MFKIEDTTKIKEDGGPLHIWRVEIRALSFKTVKDKFSKIIVIQSDHEADAAGFIRKHLFTDQWWENMIITDLTSLGDVDLMQGTKLPYYED